MEDSRVLRHHIRQNWCSGTQTVNGPHAQRASSPRTFCSVLFFSLVGVLVCVSFLFLVFISKEKNTLAKCRRAPPSNIFGSLSIGTEFNSAEKGLEFSFRFETWGPATIKMHLRSLYRRKRRDMQNRLDDFLESNLHFMIPLWDINSGFHLCYLKSKFTLGRTHLRISLFFVFFSTTWEVACSIKLIGTNEKRFQFAEWMLFKTVLKMPMNFTS